MTGHPRLHAIIDIDTAARANWTPTTLARAFLDGGARLLQLRAKQMPSGLFLALCDEVVALGQAYDARVIVNDRVDLAWASGAAGVHVGQDDLPPVAARHQLGAGAVIGWSTHTVAQIASAAQEPLTYVALGPIFETTSKATGYAPIGVAGLREAARRLRGPRLPLVAIGGVTLSHVPAVRRAGATAVAVISDLLVGNRPSLRVRDYLDALG